MRALPRHAIADGHVLNPGTNFEHDPRVAVPRLSRILRRPPGLSPVQPSVDLGADTDSGEVVFNEDLVISEGR